MNYLSIYLKGLVMGVVDVVLGVLGGIIVFIIGIYDILFESICCINFSLFKVWKV